MRRDAFAVSVTDARGRVVAVNDAQCTLLQMDKHNVVGRYWSEWTPQEDIPRLQLAFDRCLAGESLSMRRFILGVNGLRTAVSTQAFAFGLDGYRNVIAVSQPLYEYDELISRASADLVDYIVNMSSELAKLAERSGLHRLGILLDEVRREADQAAAIVGRP